PATTDSKVSLFRRASMTIHALFEAYIIAFAPSTADELEISFRLPFATSPADDCKPHCTFRTLAWGAPFGDDPDRNESRCEDYLDALRNLSQSVRTARRRDCGGASPFSASVAYDILSTTCSGANQQPISGALRQIRSSIDIDETLLWSDFVAVHDVHDLQDNSDFEWLSDDVDDHLTIAESLENNGDIEAAQYLLSFVVFNLIIGMAGNLEPFPELFRILSRISSSL